MNEFDEEFRKIKLEVCLHEAGHLVVSKALNFETDGISVEITHVTGEMIGGAAIKLPTSLCSISQINEYCRSRVKILYAGCMAQHLENGAIENELFIKCVRGVRGKSDYDKARELIQIIRDIEFPTTQNRQEQQRELDNINLELTNECLEMVLREQDIIIELAESLNKKASDYNENFSLNEEEISKLKKFHKRFGK